MTTTLSSIITGGKDSGIGGSGKRAAYAMLSCNSSSTWFGYALYDDNFAMPLVTGYPAGYNNYGPSPVVYMDQSTYLYGNNTFFDNNYSASQSYASSSGTGSYINATNSNGEFGNAALDVFSDGTYGRPSRTSGSWNNKHYLNAYAINSDHSDKRNVYLLNGGYLRCVDRLFGAYNADKPGTTAYTISGLNSSMQGSASYHKARKELTILSYTGSGTYNIITFGNVDFDTYPNPTAALTASGVTTTIAALTIPNWLSNDGESYYNLKPVVTNDGSLFISVFFQSNNLSLYKVTRNGTTAVTATRVAYNNNTTSYGRDSGIEYGQRQITSKDGTSVACYCPYYYYGSGIQCFMIDKTNNTYTSYSNTNSGYGYTCMPWKDSGWVFWYNGNCYASNYSGGSLQAVYSRGPNGVLTQIHTNNVYMPQFTGPNTTNYPGFTQVVDYVLLPSTSYGVK